jgi:hypothetical protein
MKHYFEIEHSEKDDEIIPLFTKAMHALPGFNDVPEWEAQKDAILRRNAAKKAFQEACEDLDKTQKRLGAKVQTLWKNKEIPEHTKNILFRAFLPHP